MKTRSIRMVMAGLLAAAGLAGGCTQTRSMGPGYPVGNGPSNVPEVVSFSVGQPQIHMEATLLLVPTRVLEATAIAKGDGAVAGGSGMGSQRADTLKAIPLDAQKLAEFTSAIEHSRRVIAQPRMDLLSGQPTTFAATKSIPYVQRVDQTATPSKSGGAAGIATTSQTGTVTAGVWLEVTASIATDGKTLLTQLRPTVTTLEGIDTFALPTDKSAVVQIPRSTTSSLSGTVSIPDGGTALVVGPTRNVEAEEVTSG